MHKISKVFFGGGGVFKTFSKISLNKIAKNGENSVVFLIKNYKNLKIIKEECAKFSSFLWEIIKNSVDNRIHEQCLKFRNVLYE